jgi:hypothetical protein
MRKTKIVPERGSELLIPLHKLKKSPRNARKTPHGEDRTTPKPRNPGPERER